MIAVASVRQQCRRANTRRRALRCHARTLASHPMTGRSSSSSSSGVGGAGTGRYNLRARRGGRVVGVVAAAAVPERRRGLCPLLCLAEDQPEFFRVEILARLDPAARAMLWRAAPLCRAAVESSCLPRAGRLSRFSWNNQLAEEGEEVLLELRDFVGSVQLIAWAKDNGCSWNWAVCAHAADGGHLEVLKWARAHGRQWTKSALTCASAASGEGTWSLSTWSCPWDRMTCVNAAQGGHLETLAWARALGCAWWGGAG